MIRLSAEPDYQSFLMKFKQKLQMELVKIFCNLGGRDLMGNLDSMTINNSITYLFKLIEQNDKCNGFVIFIDDIYKPPGYERTALNFINHLQTFKDEITQEMSLGNIGFFISAPLEWKITLNEKQAYSGSISLEEDMPLPTVEEARAMFNQRLAAFAVNKEKYREIKQDFADQVYRTLKSRNAFTFRQFIRECLTRVRSGKFDILTSNPVLINHDTLKSISQIMKVNSRLNDKINEILDSPLPLMNKTECFELLVDMFNKKGYTEDSEVFKKNYYYYFETLKKAGLITKNKASNGKTVWNVSNELFELDRTVRDKFGYYLDDYFLKLFEGRIQVKKIESGSSDSEEIVLIQKLIDQFRDRADTKLSSIYHFLRDALSFHKRIIEKIDMIRNPVRFTRLAKDCNFSIRSISNAVATYAGMEATGIDFWNDYWQYPESLRNFTKVLDKQRLSHEPDIVYLFGAYNNAFTDTVKFFSEQIAKDKSLPIPFVGLKVEDLYFLNVPNHILLAHRHFHIQRRCRRDR